MVLVRSCHFPSPSVAGRSAAWQQSSQNGLHVGVGRRLSFAYVFDVGDEALVMIRHVGDHLNSAVRQVHLVLALNKTSMLRKYVK
jgi:hypothetical protein